METQIQLIWNSDFNAIVNQKQGADNGISSCFRLQFFTFQLATIAALQLPDVYFLGP